MKKFFFLVCFGLFLINTLSLAAQPATIDYETVGNGWSWRVFSNGPTQAPTDFSVVSNPLIGGINTSPSCAKFVVKSEAARWAGVSTSNISSVTLDATNCIIKVLVNKDVLSNFQLGFKVNPEDEEADAIQVSNTTTGVWEELTFDFSAYIGKTYTYLEIMPDFAAGARTYGSTNYWDNISFNSETTVDPENLGVINFETVGHNWTWTVFSNGTAQAPTDFTIAPNPLPAGINTSPQSAKLIVHSDAARWAGVTTTIPSIKLDATNCIVKVLVYKDKTSSFQIGLKINPEDEEANAAIQVSNITTGVWEELTFDFSDHIGKTYTGLIVIPDFAASARTYGSTNYWDNISFNSNTIVDPGILGTIDFETIGNNWTWSVFSNGSPNDATVVSNPLTTGINTSATCAKLVVKSNAARWAGVYSLNFPNTTLNAGNCIIKVLVHKDVLSPFQVGFKVNPEDEEADAVEVTNTLTGAWQELTFDFSAFIGKTYHYIQFIPDFAVEARSYGSINYWDDISFSQKIFTNSSSNTSNNLRFFPNPLHRVLNINADAEISHITINNLAGQTVKQKHSAKYEQSIDVSDLQAGAYFVTLKMKDGNYHTQKVVKL